jgi:phospholipid/cholesterol/gamma-HCH transport system permease protein
LNYDTPPGLDVAAGSQGKIVRLSGQWTALALARDRSVGRVMPRLWTLVRAEPVGQWDLSRIDRMDHVGGQALWRVWGHKMPADTTLTDTQRDIFERIALLDSARETV